MRDVAIGTDQDPRPFRRNDLGRVAASQTIEEPAAVVKPGIGHSIPGLQASVGHARRKGAGPIMQSQLVGRIAAPDRWRFVETFAQAKHRRGYRQAFGFVRIQQLFGSAAGDVR